MMLRILSAILIVCLMMTAPLMAAEKVENKIDDSRCTGKKCVCYNMTQLKKLQDGLIEGKKCAIDLEYANKKVDELQKFGKSKEPQWYQDPHVIVGGVVISFAVGGIVTWAIMK